MPSHWNLKWRFNGIPLGRQDSLGSSYFEYEIQDMLCWFLRLLSVVRGLEESGEERNTGIYTYMFPALKEHQSYTSNSGFTFL